MSNRQEQNKGTVLAFYDLMLDQCRPAGRKPRST